MSQTIYYLKAKSSFVLTLVLIIGAVTLTACEGKDLSRARAQSLITQSPAFVQLGTLPLDNQYESEPSSLDKANDAETIEQGRGRNLRRFLSYNPKIAVANHLGLVTIEQQLVKEEKAVGLQVPAQWFFTVKVRANEKGKALWKDYKQPPDETAIPLAEKEFVSIGGITSLAENQRMAEFVWRWKTNSTGLALQENTNEFKALPVELQKGLLGQTEGNRQLQTEEWSGERQGKAIFQKYDDGWRLVRYW